MIIKTIIQLTIVYLSSHLYLLACIYFLSFWTLLFIVGENKKLVLLTSIGGLVMGPIVSVMHLRDWWHPNFIMESIIKIEDLIFGFASAGIISAVYIITSSKNKKKKIQQNQLSFFMKIFIIFTSFVILITLFYILHFHSFWASIITMNYTIVIYLLYCGTQSVKSTYVIEMLCTGVFMVIIAVPGYLLSLYLNPEWINHQYYLANLSHLLIMGIPIEELIWFLISGISISVFQELFFRRN